MVQLVKQASMISKPKFVKLKMITNSLQEIASLQGDIDCKRALLEISEQIPLLVESDEVQPLQSLEKALSEKDLQIQYLQ